MATPKKSSKRSAKKATAKTPARKTAARKARKTAARNRPAKLDAIKQLTDDHARVKKMFKQYDKLAKSDAGDAEKRKLALMICSDLTAHALAEEELFYPAARSVLKEVDRDLIDEADVEHATAKDLIAQIQASSPADDHYDAKVKVLGEYINHHVEEEEGEIFPKVRRARLDTEQIGLQLAERKAQLLAGSK